MQTMDTITLMQGGSDDLVLEMESSSTSLQPNIDPKLGAIRDGFAAPPSGSRLKPNETHLRSTTTRYSRLRVL